MTKYQKWQFDKTKPVVHFVASGKYYYKTRMENKVPKCEKFKRGTKEFVCNVLGEELDQVVEFIISEKARNRKYHPLSLEDYIPEK